MTKNNTGLILNFALNYGGRAEITQALKSLAQEVLDAKINPGDITEDMIGDYLFTQHLPKDLRDPDLIIRTSGELRLSNFLPWQAAYSELYFTDTLWPDFDEAALQEAIAALTIAIAVLEEFRRRYDQGFTKENIVCGIGPGNFPSSLVCRRALVADRDWLVSDARRP